MFLTKRQKEILDAQTPIERHGMIPSHRLNITDSSIDSTNTHIFNNFREALKIMTDPDYEEIFRGRMKKHSEEIWEATRIIRGILMEYR